MSATTKILGPCVSSSAPVGAKPLQTGQVSSFGTDDNFDSGRATDFNTLASNNPFGNTLAHTDTLGGTTYTNNILVDWTTYDGVTVTCWLITKQSAAFWTASKDAAVLINAGGFSSGWKLPTLREHLQLVQVSKTRSLNYAPFNDASNDKFWTGTTLENYTGNPAAIQNQFGYISYADATNNPWRPIREYTLADLGL
jgi:hypothetical protein